MRTLVAITLLIILSIPATAQRYLPGMAGIQVAGGAAFSNGFFAHAGYAKYTVSKNRWVFDIEYLQSNYEYLGYKIPVAQFTGEAGYYLRFLSDNSQSFFLSFGALIGTGFETVNMGNNKLDNGAIITNQDKWIYGGAVALEAEYYLDDKYVLIGFVKERIYGGSSVCTFHTQVGIGIKFILDSFN